MQQRLLFIGVSIILLATILAVVIGGSVSLASFAAARGGISSTSFTSSPSGSTAERGLARVHALPSSLVGKIIHYRTDIYQFVQGSADPGNGRVIHADVWQQLGSDGIPTFYHAQYTFTGGRFYQEIYDTPKAALVVRGHDYAALFPHIDSRWCLQRLQHDPRALAGYVPSFRDDAGLAQDGYQQTGSGPSKPLPKTTAQGITPPSFVYPASSGTHVWSHHESTSDHSSVVEVYTTTSNSRVVVQELRHQDASGKVVQEFWRALGDLYAYAPAAALPATVFAQPRQLTEGCN